jgi:hypothetical protein
MYACNFWTVCTSSNLKIDVESSRVIRISYAICPDTCPIFYEMRALRRARCVETCTSLGAAILHIFITLQNFVTKKFLMTLPYRRIYVKIGNYLERHGSGLTEVLSWRDWEKPRNISTNIVGVLADIRTGYVLNTSQERYRLSRNIPPNLVEYTFFVIVYYVFCLYYTT